MRNIKNKNNKYIPFVSVGVGVLSMGILYKI